MTAITVHSRLAQCSDTCTKENCYPQYVQAMTGKKTVTLSRLAWIRRDVKKSEAPSESVAKT